MPHYKDGTEAQAGDVILAESYAGRDLVCVTRVLPSKSCNLQGVQLATEIDLRGTKFFVPRPGQIITANCDACERIWPPVAVAPGLPAICPEPGPEPVPAIDPPREPTPAEPAPSDPAADAAAPVADPPAPSPVTESDTPAPSELAPAAKKPKPKLKACR